MKKKITGLILGVLLAVLPAVPVFAVPDDVDFVTLTPSNTSIVIRWNISTGSTSTLVRYSTATYPATTADGTQAYSGTDYEYTLTGLTSGTTYYFSVWGYDGADYSATTANAVTTTTATVVPDGGAPDAQSDIVAFPSWQAPQAPDTSGFQLEPISTILAYFQSAPGGLNMPVANLWETMFIIGLVALGAFLYVKTKNFFVAMVGVMVLTWVGADRELCQWELLYIEATLAAAVFAVERVFS